MKLPYIEPYKIKSIETINSSTPQERERWIAEADYNVFNLSSDKVIIDLLTDSGTTAMSDKQWAAIMTGDESYAGSVSFLKLREVIKDLLGFEYLLPTHQGRAAENVMFSGMVNEGDIVPGNAHFDTTKGHIEFRKAKAVDCTIDEAFDIYNEHPFKGNIDLEKLEKVLTDTPKEKIPFVIITATCNTAGGQPVSLKNISDVAQMCRKYGVKVIFDAARFAENAYFIKEREDGYAGKSIKDIVTEMFSYADACTMSSKKDGLVNIGGFIALRDEEIYQKLTLYNIMFEGYITYGGLAGRDMAALAQGLQEVTDYNYLHSRITQVKYLGELLDEYGIPVQKPYGGHAIYVEAKKFFSDIPQSEFPAQLLAVELYKEAGVRATEIGTLLADRDPVTRKNRYPKLELLRLAIPRRVYTFNHIKYIAVALKNIYDKKESYKNGLKIVWEAPIMRHFTVKLDLIEK